MHYPALLLCLLITVTTYGQYPFEKFPAVKYKEYNDWKETDNAKHPGKKDYSLTVQNFFGKIDSLTITIITPASIDDSTFISIYRNKKLIQSFSEITGPYLFEPLRLADFNGDKLTDLKLIVSYMGCGVAAMNMRVIYFLQHKDGSFTKISYLDKMEKNRPERDFNGDGNYEIITMSLISYQDHNYWLYNLFNFKNFDILSVNEKYNYPIMIQFLYHTNYKITNKVSRQKMKEFAMKKPEEYDRQ